MDPSVGEKPAADLRDYLAEERTFLAWIRTGLTLMGFGFVVAPHGLSPWIGTAFIAAGVAVNLLSTRRHLLLIAELNRGQFAERRPSQLAVILALFLALVGVAMALYLTLT